MRQREGDPAAGAGSVLALTAQLVEIESKKRAKSLPALSKEENMGGKPVSTLELL